MFTRNELGGLRLKANRAAWSVAEVLVSRDPCGVAGLPGRPLLSTDCMAAQWRGLAMRGQVHTVLGFWCCGQGGPGLLVFCCEKTPSLFLHMGSIFFPVKIPGTGAHKQKWILAHSVGGGKSETG